MISFPALAAERSLPDLAALLERQHLVTALIGAGKSAFDGGDFATAAAQWERLLQQPGLDGEVTRVMRPWAAEARARAGGRPREVPARAAAAPEVKAPSAITPTTVSGAVAGGGAVGPGGTVIWLKRTDGPTPRPAPLRGRVVNQINKAFVPRVIPVTVGTKVDFRNNDEILHNVFSLTPQSEFDTGLYKMGGSYSKTFSKPGPVQLLCNIHASMLGYVVVVETPYFGQADAGGAFTIKGVPPGDYELSAWHENSNRLTTMPLSVRADGVRGLTVRVDGGRKAAPFVPDKYGKPRQAQLGY